MRTRRARDQRNLEIPSSHSAKPPVHCWITCIYSDLLFNRRVSLRLRRGVPCEHATMTAYLIPIVLIDD